MWGRLPIELQADYVINEKIAPALALAGSTLADIVKAQVYFTHVEDIAPFNELWLRHVGEQTAVTSYIPCRNPGLAIDAARVEINVVALAGDASASRQSIGADVALPYRGQPAAVKAGDLLFLAGLMAADGNGLAPDAAPDPAYAHYGDDAETQAEWIIRRAERLCAAAGTSLANVVRVLQFHTDIADAYAVHRAWQRALPGRPIPFAAVEVPVLPVPGCKVLMDLWVYAP
jgi:enamine deaminase RidA (YjgF/YER057c/UK114 family)